MDLLARTQTPESRAFARDEASRAKHARGAVKAFRALAVKSVSMADEAKASFPGRDQQSLDRRLRAFTKLAKENEEVQKYLDQWIGKEEVDSSAYSWRAKVTYALRDYLLGGLKLADALKIVEKYALVSFQALTMHEVQAPIREAIPPEVMDYLPKTVVVKVNPKGKITEITDRFRNEYVTLAVKAKQMRRILSQYNRIAREVKKDLRSKDETTRLSALVTAIIMETGIRPGRIGNGKITTKDGQEQFVETFGAATLGPGHIKFVRDNFAELEFVGKKGGVNTARLSDADIVKVLQSYVAKALKEGSPYVFVTKAGVPYDYNDLDRYFRQKMEGINPTDFRKLRATEEVLNAIVDEQGNLYERIRKLKKLKKDELKQAIVTEVISTLQTAITRSQSALSHESETTTVDSYIHPGVLFRFLSTGRIEKNLSDILATGKTELKFDPEAFLSQALGRKAFITDAPLSGTRKRAFSVRASMDYDLALEELYPSLNEWVFYGSSQAKKDLVAAYESLPPNLRRAWDEGVKRAFVSHHGGTTARMYRRMKRPSDTTSTSGLSVTTDDDLSRKAQYVAVFEVTASDVLAHHAQTDTPLASKSFGHEKEVILAPGNRAKLVTVLENW